ncbi:MAG TPA: nucleotide exchange factor GrpE [Acidimicrobiales bacterium]|nr:nucleotide exchange factor GrpE [Acidimicrobiales bacterium]
MSNQSEQVESEPVEEAEAFPGGEPPTGSDPYAPELGRDEPGDGASSEQERTGTAEVGEPEPPAAEGPTSSQAGEPGSEDDASESGELIEEAPPSDLEQLAAERDDYLDSLRRLQADFDNYRKRAVRQQTELLERAAERLLLQLLPVLDALDLAEAHAAENPDAAALAQIGTLLRDVVAREGLERIDEVGIAFDPTVHDAVAHEPAEEGEAANSVSEVMRAGYRLKGRVLRPAMVKVRG